MCLCVYEASKMGGGGRRNWIFKWRECKLEGPGETSCEPARRGSPERDEGWAGTRWGEWEPQSAGFGCAQLHGCSVGSVPGRFS